MTKWELLMLLLALETLIDENKQEKALQVLAELKAELNGKIKRCKVGLYGRLFLLYRRNSGQPQNYTNERAII